jgi:hypothetical protein
MTTMATLAARGYTNAKIRPSLVLLLRLFVIMMVVYLFIPE